MREVEQEIDTNTSGKITLGDGGTVVCQRVPYWLIGTCILNAAEN